MEDTLPNAEADTADVTGAALQRASFSLLLLIPLSTDCAAAQRRRERAGRSAGPDLVSRITTIKEGGARLDWMDSRIAFDMLGPGDFFAVYSMRPDGSEVKCLSCNHPDLPRRNVGQPAWHPSLRYLVFQAEKAQHAKLRFERVTTPGAGVLNDLWILNLETDRARMLREVGNAPGQGTLHAHFSPDGSRLSWTEMREKGGLRKGKELGYWALMIADFRTDRGTPRLDNVRSYTPGGNAFYENHGFSPDGTRLIFTSNFEAKRRLENHIYVMDLRTEKLTRLTTEGYNEHAAYSPDGRYVAWISNVGNRAGGTDYWIMDGDGSNKRRLTYFNEKGHPHYAGARVVVADASWRPDGTAFAGYYREGGSLGLESKSSRTKIILIEVRLGDLRR